MKKTVLLLTLALHSAFLFAQQTIDLSGEWLLRLDGQKSTSRVLLPGTTDTNRKGMPLRQKNETTHLARLFSYRGKAWYTREIDIPRAWQRRPLVLTLERTKPSKLFIDGVLIDSCNNISTPHRYQLRRGLKAGRHTVMLLIDNGSGVPEQLYASSHAYTEDTQTNWNGIIGQMTLSLQPRKRAAERQVVMRQPSITVRDRHFYDARGHRLFLRGKHDACVWPLTGHCPMDVESWRQYFATCSDYGINHVRFHSWCPPEAAFAAADALGIYLQPELPFWGDFNAGDSVLMAFLHKEGENILREYAHHPSFAMFALGNELWGSVAEMSRFVADFRITAPFILYTLGSNYYLGYEGVKQGMDYFTTCRVGGEAWGSYDTHTRGSFSFADAKTGGMLNSERPNTEMTLDAGCRRSSVPVISHETGQFQIYPDYHEMLKYTGVLYPYNMQEFRSRLAEAGMADQAADFHRASGLWAVQLYKADIELDLRTESMDGFQLLDLQDYPGQGSAYVGVLDAFMQSKGLVSEREWRQWCSDVVPLALMPRYVYTAGDEQTITLKIANYSGGSLSGRQLRWVVGNEEGFLSIPDGEGLLVVGEITFHAPQVERAQQLQLALVVDGTEHLNTYPLWVYPPHKAEGEEGSVIVVDRMSDDVAQQLTEGASVLWMPDTTEFRGNTVPWLFQTDYWNYRMFRTICKNNGKTPSPGTMGILCDPRHPVFRQFPTEMHTNWQWYDVIRDSRPIILDNLIVSYRPIVQVIDNVERNHRLGLLFEFRVGKGKLMMFMSHRRNELYHSILEYMNSDAFQPTYDIMLSELIDALRQPVSDAQLEELNNISPY